jgi:hypothetical protein
MKPLVTKAMRRRVALPKRIAEDTSLRVFAFAKAFVVRAHPLGAFDRLIRALPDDTILSKLRSQRQSWPTAPYNVLTYAS